MAAITSAGIGSGIDINSLVTQLVNAQSQPVTSRIASDQKFYQAELSAYSKVKGALSGLQTAVADIKNAATFNKRTVTSSDETAVTATATSKATTGSFSVEVSQLAKAQSLASQSYSSTTQAIGTGTLVIKFGTTSYDASNNAYNGFTESSGSATANIVINDQNDSLQGISQAINDANIGVSATIVNDGSGYRLLLNSQSTGASNSMQITTVGDSDGNDTDSQGLSGLSFNQSANFLTQTAAGQDANFKINGLSMTSASNQVSDVMSGVTLDLKSTTTLPVGVTVAQDTASVKSGIEKFVNSYRAFNSVVTDLSKFDAASGQGAILIGDATLRSVASQVRNVLNSPVQTFSDAFSTLAELGITTDQSGNLNIDSTKLDQALSTNFDAVASLFSAYGQSTDSGISFVSSSSATQPGQYDVNVSSLATQGKIVGASVLPDFSSGSVTIDGANDTMKLQIDGVTGSPISLVHGTYTSGADLAKEIESEINGVQEFKDAGISAKVSYDASTNALTITSDRYGSASAVNVLTASSAFASTLGFSVASGTGGTDVIGTIGGVAGTGSGQILTGATDSPSEGLAISVDGGSTGARSPVRFSRGIGDKLDSLATSLLGTDGPLDARTQGINDSLKELDKETADNKTKMAELKARLQAQYGAMDTLVAQLQSTGNFLSSALSSLPKSTS